MRLNRVLLLAAVISMAMIAMVFTISCSDGADGRNGDVCTVSATDNGYNVTCGGNSAGQLTSGPAGEPGAPGAPGNDGVPGPDCGLTVGTGGIYNITCAGELRGVLEGCKTVAVNQEITISCVGSSIISLCNGMTFNPATQYCDYNGSTSTIASIGNFVCGSTQIPFNPNQRYCGYASEEAYLAKTPTVLPLCVAPAGTDPDQTGTPNPANNPNDSALTRPNWAGPVTGKTPLQATAVADWELKGATSWQDEYCSVSRRIQYTNSTDRIQSRRPLVVYKTAKATLCGGVLSKFNEDSYKGEYCGFADAEAVLPSKVNNACGDGRGPDSAAFDRAYCQMVKKADYYTEVQYNYCNEGPEGATRSTINRVDKFTLLTSDDWKDGGEFCAYTSQANAEAGIKTKRKGICDDGKAPNDTAQGRVFNNQYCQVPLANYLLNKTSPKTQVTVANEAYCLKENSTGDAWKSAGSDARVNENTWKHHYCGYASKLDADSANPTVIKTRKVCTNVAAGTDGRTPIGPNSNQSGYGWSNAYCMAKWPGALSDYVTGNEDVVISPIPPVGNTPSPAARTYKSYCIAHNPGYTVSAINDPNGRINEDEWQDQYCGYASRTDFYGGMSGLATIAKRNVSVMSGHCTKDGKAPNTVAGPDTAVVTATTPASEGYYLNEYCQIKYDDRVEGKTSRVGLPQTGLSSSPTAALGTNVPTDAIKEAIFEVFCIADTTVTESINIAAANADPNIKQMNINNDVRGFREIYGKVSLASQRLNQRPAGPQSSYRWPSQYCGFEEKAAMERLKATVTIANPEQLIPDELNTAANRWPAFSRLTGVCDNISTELSDAGLELSAAKVGPNRAGRPIGKTVWLAEYCQVQTSSDGKSPNATTTLVGITPTSGQMTPTTFGPIATDVVSGLIYCWEGSVPASGNTVRDVFGYSGPNRVNRSLNLGSWQNQFCFKNAQRGTCRTGQAPVGYGKPYGNAGATNACFSSTTGTIIAGVTSQNNTTSSANDGCERPQGNWSNAYCSDNGTYFTNNGITTLPVTPATCEVPANTWTQSGNCSGNTDLTTQLACEAPKGVWTNGTCAITFTKTDVNATDEAACEAKLSGSWSNGSCSGGDSDGSESSKAACLALTNAGSWTDGTCTFTPPTLTGVNADDFGTNKLCENTAAPSPGSAGYTITGTLGTCTKASVTTSRANCEAANLYTWNNTSSCSDGAFATQGACESAKKGTWNTATCGGCTVTNASDYPLPTPVTKPTCLAKFVWTPEATGTCTGAPSLTNAQNCEAPKGVWTNGTCAITFTKTDVNTTDEAACEAKLSGSWSNGSCSGGDSDGSESSKAACLALTNAGSWTDGTCTFTPPTLTGVNADDFGTNKLCENTAAPSPGSAGYTITGTLGTCAVASISDATGTDESRDSCQAPNGTWPGQCSNKNANYNTKSACQAQVVGTWASVDGNFDVNQATCNANRGIWLYNGGIRGANTSGASTGLAFKNAGEAGACE